MRQPGAVLLPGIQVAHLDLDDLSSVKLATPFGGQLPTENQIQGTKVNQLFEESLEALRSFMNGFSVPEEATFRAKIEKYVNMFFACLKDPALPLLEFRVSATAHVLSMSMQCLLCYLCSENVNIVHILFFVHIFILPSLL